MAATTSGCVGLQPVVGGCVWEAVQTDSNACVPLQVLPRWQQALRGRY